MSTSEILDKVRQFVTENFLYTRPDFVLGEEDSLLGTGIIDSMGIMELVVFLEEQFGIEVGDTEITEENLGTLSSIVGYVGTKRRSAAAA